MVITASPKKINRTAKNDLAFSVLRVLNPGIINILDRMILGCGCCPMLCQKFNIFLVPAFKMPVISCVLILCINLNGYGRHQCLVKHDFRLFL